MAKAKKKSVSKGGPLQAAPVGSLGGNYSLMAAHAGYSSLFAYSAAWACVQVLVQDLAKLPFGIWEGDDAEGWRPAKRHALYSMLRRPNAWMTRMDLLRYQMLSLLLEGNSYSLIVRDREYEPTQLIPIHPRYVQVYQAYDGELFYRVSRQPGALEAALDGRDPMVPQRDILHIRHLSIDGVIGLSPITAARTAIEYGMNLERQGAGLAGRGGKPGGVIKMPTRLSPEQAKRLREEWDTVYNGEGVGRTAILEEGITFEPLSFRAVDAQFLELRKFQAEEVARIFRVHPYMIGIMDKLSYNNVEHLNKSYVDSTLMPHAENFEQAYSAAFDLDASYSLEFDYDYLLRADTAGRYNKYAMGIQWSVLSPNDARRQEGENPYEGGNVYLRPLNMAPVQPDGQTMAVAVTEE